MKQKRLLNAVDRGFTPTGESVNNFVDTMLGLNEFYAGSNDGDDAGSEAKQIYDQALSEHPEWFNQFNQGEDDPDLAANMIHLKVLKNYDVDANSDVANLLYERILAGLT